MLAALGLDLGDDDEALEQIELEAKYDGYVRAQLRIIDRAERLESMRLPDSLLYAAVKGLSHESVEKLDRVRPATIGQAARIPGVRPSDIAILIGSLRSGSPLPRA
jgi:tRNA uridine 5-carboxymethylaminomethyl modification enzyme